MNVLHINDYRTGGGCEVLVAATIDLLQSRGVETELFTIEDVPGFRLSPLSYINNRAARTALRRTLNEFQPEAIHLHNYYHVLSPGILREIAAWRAQRNCRVVMTAHDYHLVCPNSGGMWFRGAPGSGSGSGPGPGGCRQHRGNVMRGSIDSRRVHTPAYVLTRRWDRRSLSHSMLKIAQHVFNYWFIDARRVVDLVLCPSQFLQRLVRNAGMRTLRLTHPAPLTNQDMRGRYGPLRLVFAGRIEPEKGLAEFLEIIPEGFEGMLTVIGEGGEMVRCRAIVQGRGLSDRVEFLGRLPHAQTTAIIARCHALVLPSLCLENYPLSLIEALAAGTNILVSGHGGMKEMVDEFGVGLLFTPGDADSLASAIKRIQSSHANGTINAFDVREAMTARSEQSFIDALVRVYRGHRSGATPA